MSSVSSLDGVTPSSELGGSETTTGTTELDKDAFLRLLTTQMQYQDPLDPMSNEEFVAQLAQFSSLEELQNISGGLDSLYMVGVSMNNASMVSLLGQTVVATSDQVHYDGDGEQLLHYDASAAAASATLTITDADGSVVRTVELGALAEGEGSYSWDGLQDDGTAAPEGDYTLSISALDSDGASVTVTSLLVGTVTEMDYSTGTPVPEVDGIAVEMGDILRVDHAEAE